jgi:hypothetical protein
LVSEQGRVAVRRAEVEDRRSGPELALPSSAA